MVRFILTVFSILMLTSVASAFEIDKPTIFIVGDSTVKNGSGKGEDGLWGWGDFLDEHFDLTKIDIRNDALGGRSSRTFITQGLWSEVLSQVKSGDYVIIQFGHNDGGNINDDSRARGTIKGVGAETEEIDNILTDKHEVVHTYGWYMSQYITDTKEKGATPIVCSLVPRNIWLDGKVVRAEQDYTKWAEEVAKARGAYFIDLNNLVALRYESLGENVVTSKLFLTDHTHTTEEGARINASAFVEGLKNINGFELNKYLNKGIALSG